MDFVELDIENPESIASVAASLVKKYPKLNVLINNAGIMKPDAAQGAVDDAPPHGYCHCDHQPSGADPDDLGADRTFEIAAKENPNPM